MKTKKILPKKETRSVEEKKYFSSDGKSYIQKTEDGFYKAFLKDGAELKNVTLPINIALMALRCMLPSGVKICPSAEDIEMDPALKKLRDAYMSQSPF